MLALKTAVLTNFTNGMHKISETENKSIPLFSTSEQNSLYFSILQNVTVDDFNNLKTTIRLLDVEIKKAIRHSTTREDQTEEIKKAIPIPVSNIEQGFYFGSDKTTQGGNLTNSIIGRIYYESASKKLINDTVNATGNLTFSTDQIINYCEDVNENAKKVNETIFNYILQNTGGGGRRITFTANSEVSILATNYSITNNFKLLVDLPNGVLLANLTARNTSHQYILQNDVTVASSLQKSSGQLFAILPLSNDFISISGKEIQYNENNTISPNVGHYTAFKLGRNTSRRLYRLSQFYNNVSAILFNGDNFYKANKLGLEEGFELPFKELLYKIASSAESQKQFISNEVYNSKNNIEDLLLFKFLDTDKILLDKVYCVNQDINRYSYIKFNNPVYEVSKISNTSIERMVFFYRDPITNYMRAYIEAIYTDEINNNLITQDHIIKTATYSFTGLINRVSIFATIQGFESGYVKFKDIESQAYSSEIPINNIFETPYNRIYHICHTNFYSKENFNLEIKIVCKHLIIERIEIVGDE